MVVTWAGRRHRRHLRSPKRGSLTAIRGVHRAGGHAFLVAGCCLWAACMSTPWTSPRLAPACGYNNGSAFTLSSHVWSSRFVSARAGVDHERDV